MYKLALSVLLVSVLAMPALAQIRTCVYAWQTTNADGTADVAGADGTACTPVTGYPPGTCVGGTTAATADAICTFVVLKRGYRCCYTVQDTTFATPGAGSTFTTPPPGTTVTPQNLKPKCPNGVLSSVIAKTNQPVTCNLTNLASQPCTTGFTCTKARNVVDVNGTPLDFADDMGAANTPYLCCKSTQLASFKTAFVEAGLSTAIVPAPPTAGIDVVTLGGTPTQSASMGDDLSYLLGQLTTLPLTVTLFTPTSALLYYHILFFDATTNKDCAFVANIVGDGTTVLTFPTTFPPTAPIAYASVYNSGPAYAVSPVYRFNATGWSPTLYNTAKHTFVTLVFATPAELTFAAAGVKSATLLNLNSGLYGDFEPGRVVGQAGVFVNVTTLLKGKLSYLGPPIAGSYFFLKQ